jgi:hypothetical protein
MNEIEAKEDQTLAKAAACRREKLNSISLFCLHHSLSLDALRMDFTHTLAQHRG